jgi:NADPH:quinone reductase-like Zn-dependent oxidoreductase
MKLRRILKWTVALIFVVLVAWLFVAYWMSTNDCNRFNAVPTNPMKAIVYCEYGLANLLLKDIEKPVPADNELLVRVRASCVNPADMICKGGARIVTGLRKPKITRLGTDFAGTVEAVGKNVTKFKSGDEVFGGKTGAFAEYVCVREDRAIALKPANMTFEQVASVGIAGITALQGLRDKGKIQSGQKVLVNGASGGVGTFAVQIAKAFGAEVTGVCSARNLDLVRSIGADQVIDYSKEDFTKVAERYDLFFDNIQNHSFSERRRILSPSGICVMVGVGGSGASGGQIIGALVGELNAYIRSRFTSQKFLTFLAQFNQKDLNILADLMQSGKITPVIDRTYKLNEIAEAFRYLEQGHARGKVVITVSNESQAGAL